MARHVAAGRGLALVGLAVASGAILISVVGGSGALGPLPAADVTSTNTVPTTIGINGSTTTTAAGATTTTTRSGTATTAATTATTAGSTATTRAGTTRATVSLGSTGADVTYLQQRLAALGYNPGAADGSFGAGTADAVKKFQAAKGLPADGVVGTSTWAALG